MRGGRRVFVVAASSPRGAAGTAARALGTGAAMAACAALVSACGGGSEQNAHEAKRTFTMKVVSASFPAKQAVARPAQLVISVRNTSGHVVPNLAVTVDSFNYTAATPELAANKRPIWAIERGPGTPASPPVQSQEVSPAGGGQTAYVNTWALGRLAAGKTQTFIWRVVPVKPGAHTVHYAIAAGLAGHARAALSSGGAVQGQFSVDIAPAPPVTHVDPATGKVVSGALPTVP